MNTGNEKSLYLVATIFKLVVIFLIRIPSGIHHYLIQVAISLFFYNYNSIVFHLFTLVILKKKKKTF